MALPTPGFQTSTVQSWERKLLRVKATQLRVLCRGSPRKPLETSILVPLTEKYICYNLKFHLSQSIYL